MTQPQKYRPGFIQSLRHAYSNRGKSVVLLTGDTLDLFWNENAERFIPLPQVLYQEYSDKFTIIRFDASGGINFYDEKDREEVIRVCALADSGQEKKENRLGDVSKMIGQSMHNPLPGLVTLREISNAFIRAKQGTAVADELSKLRKEAPSEPAKPVKPLCIVMHFAASLFPTGDFDRLNELDRQRLVTFLDWINDPAFVKGENLVILLADTRSEMNSRILALPSAQHVEVALPDDDERKRFIEYSLRANLKSDTCNGLILEKGVDGFVSDSAGLGLTTIEDLVEQSVRGGQQLTRKDVLRETNALLEKQLGGVVTVTMPTHGIADLIGNDEVKLILQSIFDRCNDPETAVSSIIVPGPNGSGKTFTLEAFAADSGRIVIELTGLRGSYFGETDKFFETFRWYIRTYGKIIVLVDEAHTAFGSIHSKDTHETEKRLAGNIIKMMSDSRFFGKVMWGLMTSRPDKLDPDLISRSPIQIPIFDPQGDARELFVKGMFAKKKIELGPDELKLVIGRTGHYCSRDYRDLVKEVIGAKKSVSEVLDYWGASSAIVVKRRMQSLIAANHCTYPKLLPKELADMTPEARENELAALRHALGEYN